MQIVDKKGNPITDFGSDITAPSVVGIKSISNGVINPSTLEKQDEIKDKLDTISQKIEESPSTFESESLWLLRRLVKLMESQGTVDIANRQRVAVESAIITSGTVTTVSTVSNLALIGGVDPRFILIEQGKINYNTGVRSHLSFT